MLKSQNRDNFSKIHANDFIFYDGFYMPDVWGGDNLLHFQGSRGVDLLGPEIRSKVVFCQL